MRTAVRYDSVNHTARIPHATIGTEPVIVDERAALSGLALCPFGLVRRPFFLAPASRVDTPPPTGDVIL